MDTERAIDKMLEVRASAETLASWFARYSGGFLQDAQYKQDAKAHNELIGAGIRIAESVDGDLGQAMRKYKGHYSDVVRICDEVIGRLRSDAEVDEILGPEGPRLAAKDLNPWVWNAAVDLWSDGHHREAVQRAATAVFDSHLPAKLGVVGKPGELVGIAFSLDPAQPGKPRLRIPGYPEGSESWRNAHDGARFLGMGCVAGIRNLATHDLAHEEQRALEQLACLSVFARLVYESDLKT